jgi:hypothetical protein
MAPLHLAFISIVLLLSQASPLASEHDKLPSSEAGYTPGRVPAVDVDSLEFPLNLEFLEAEFFLWAALGYGLDRVAPELASGGPAPIGAQKAKLDPLVREIIKEFAYQEVGHLRAIKETVHGFPRPQLNLTAANFGNIMNAALNTTLKPPFDPYANSVNYLLASYVIPYVGLTGYVGTNPNLQSPTAKRLVAGLLGVESGQDAVIRGLLFQKLSEKVAPYPYTVAEFTDKISILRNTLGHTGIADEGLYVPRALGAEGKVKGNILAGDQYSVSYGRTPAQILRIVYSSGSESSPGGFYPRGADGKIARHYLSNKTHD